MSGDRSLYGDLGVAANKEDVRAAFAEIVRRDYPRAFCNIAQDPWDSGWVMVMHADGTGSKTLSRLILYLTTGDISVFQGEPADALSMNTGDVAASGFVRPPFVFTDTIGIDSDSVPKHPILAEMAKGIHKLIGIYAANGLPLVFMGGETADLPDQMRSLVLDMTVFARMPRARVIDGNVRAGDVIFGFRSDGQAIWETRANSGHMSNGSTLTRFVLMHALYGSMYPKLFRGEKLPQGIYRMDDTPEGLGMTVGEAITSPTRQWAIVAKLLIEELRLRNASPLLHAMVMHTGGGLTKCINVGQGIVFNQQIPNPPPIFRLIQDEACIGWDQMVTGYNCGVGFSVIGSPREGILQRAVESVSKISGVPFFVLGNCERSGDSENHVVIQTPYGTFGDPHK